MTINQNIRPFNTNMLLNGYVVRKIFPCLKNIKIVSYRSLGSEVQKNIAAEHDTTLTLQLQMYRHDE